MALPKWIVDHINLYKTDPEKAHFFPFEVADGGERRMLPTLLLTTKGWDPLESTCRHASLSIL